MKKNKKILFLLSIIFATIFIQKNVNATLFSRYAHTNQITALSEVRKLAAIDSDSKCAEFFPNTKYNYLAPSRGIAFMQNGSKNLNVDWVKADYKVYIKDTLCRNSSIFEEKTLYIVEFPEYDDNYHIIGFGIVISNSSEEEAENGRLQYMKAKGLDNFASPVDIFNNYYIPIKNLGAKHLFDANLNTPFYFEDIEGTHRVHVQVPMHNKIRAYDVDTSSISNKVFSRTQYIDAMKNLPGLNLVKNSWIHYGHVYKNNHMQGDVNTPEHYRYFDENGYSVSGFKNISGKWYYFDPSTFFMIKGWKNIDGKWYYFDNFGVKKTSWLNFNSHVYYLNSQGIRLTGFQKINNKTYYFNSSGQKQYYWHKINNKTYFFDHGGVMIKGWITINKKHYYFDSNGVISTTWKTISKHKFYFDSKGVMKTNWQKIKNKMYYFNHNGIMLTKWAKINKKWYYFNTDGSKVKGWKKITNKWYYFYDKGNYKRKN